MTPADMFGTAPAEERRITHVEKLRELEREARQRENVYPKLIERGTLSEERAANQTAILRAVIADYQIQPWPQTRELVRQWRDKAEPLTVLGVKANRLHREELLAVLAFAVGALRGAGLLDETKGAINETDGAGSGT